MTGDHQKLPARYWRQWSASAISNLGDGINFVAMPLLVFSLTTDERALALTTFALFVPWLVIGLPVGVVVDRLDRKRLMASSSLLRSGLFAAIAWLVSSDHLTVLALVALLIVIGSCEVVFDSAAQAFLPSLVPKHQLARANGLLFAAEVIAGSVAGLSVGALLFEASPSLPFTVNAISFVIAAGLIVSISTHRDAVRPTQSDRRLSVGVSWLRTHRTLRTLAMMFVVTNFGLMFGQGIFVKYAIETLDLSPVGYGLLLAITAMGAATGGLVGHRVIGRFGLAKSVIGPYLVFGVAQVIIGIAPSAWLVGIAGYFLGAAITVWNVVTVTIRQQLIPVAIFGRVNAVYRWLGAAASAAGVACGGFLAYWTNLHTPYLVGGGVTLVAALLCGGPVIAGLRHDAHADDASPGAATSDDDQDDQAPERAIAPPSIT
ncbi:MAG TPA: MFS transporter [Ilumatobacter sp.]|nr:MFS transporter [Ilumatobacter sp.]